MSQQIEMLAGEEQAQGMSRQFLKVPLLIEGLGTLVNAIQNDRNKGECPTRQVTVVKSLYRQLVGGATNRCSCTHMPFSGQN